MEQETLIESGDYYPDNVLYHVWTCVGAPGNLPLCHWNDLHSAVASSLSVHIKHGTGYSVDVSMFAVIHTSSGDSIYQNIFRSH